MGIIILNIICFGCYIYCAFAFFLWILCIIIFNEIKIFEKLNKPDAQKYSEIIHLIIVFSLFFNYFFNDQNTI